MPQNWQLSGESAIRQEGPWWRAYNDKNLEEFVSQALSYNSDIQLAAARVDEARAIAGSARAQRMPNVSAGGAASRGDLGAGMLPGDTTVEDSFVLGTLLSFEIDLWGRLANADNAARQQLLAVQANAQTVVLGVTAETASNYFAIASLNEQISITRKTIKTRQKAYDLEKKRLDKGDIDALLARQAEAQLIAVGGRRGGRGQQRPQKNRRQTGMVGN